jgi:hypothetical protein
MLDNTMPQDGPTPDSAVSHRGLLVGAAGLFGVLIAGAAVLWFYYGTAVFFEMIRAGFIACFG